MDKGILDRVVDELLVLRTKVRSELKIQNKGKRPFRKEPVSERDRILEFEMIPEEKKEFARQNFPLEFQTYESEINKLKEKYNAA